jgi:hypothetical protein
MESEEKNKSENTFSVGSDIYFDDDDHHHLEAAAASKRQKRRQSIFLPSVIALKEEDPAKDDNAGIQQEEPQARPTDNFDLEQLDPGHDYHHYPVISTRKRAASKRQSMLLPSDIVLFQKEVATQLFGHEATPLELDPQEIDFRETTSTTTTTPKPRPSVVLRSDVALLQDDEAREYFQELTSSSHPQEANVVEENGVTEQTKDESRPPTTGKMPAIESVEQQQGGLHSSIGMEAAAVVTNGDASRTDPNDGNETDYIRSLVREYCALSPYERLLSKQAEEIERLTCYSLVPPAAKQFIGTSVDLNWSGSPTDGPRSQVVMPDRELLLKLGDLVQLIDERKVQDQQHAEAHTKCHFQRSRSGKYRYFHTLTNDKISPGLYEERYLAMLEVAKSKSQEHIQDWIKSIEGSSYQSVGEQVMNWKAGSVVDCDAYCGVEENEEQCSEASPNTKHILEQSPHLFGLVDRTRGLNSEDSEPTSGLDTIDSSIVLVEQVYAQANDMKLVDGSSSSPKDVLLKTKTHAPNDDDNQEPRMSSTLDTSDSSDVFVLEQASTHANDMELVDASSSSPTDSLLHEQDHNDRQEVLPFPNREEGSDDPDIAAAEATLWAAIDVALETYALQVIRIREARRLV